MAEGKKSALTDEHVWKVQILGFEWTRKRQGCSLFECPGCELLKYEENDNCNVQKKYKSNQQLGTWVSHHRSQFRYKDEGKKFHFDWCLCMEVTRNRFWLESRCRHPCRHMGCPVRWATELQRASKVQILETGFLNRGTTQVQGGREDFLFDGWVCAEVESNS